MKERPILFNGEMVRAILEGRKTQTRRPIKRLGLYAIDERYHGIKVATRARAALAAECPIARVGDRLWVRETHSFHQQMNYAGDDIDFLECIYAADGGSQLVYPPDDNWSFDGGRNYPSIHMPRWASRLLLDVVSVRVERVQDITEGDAIEEGITWGPDHDYTGAFRTLWQSAYPGSWERNDYVWVIEFTNSAERGAEGR